jgi:RNA polymerase sigma factor (sigma-70 family)
MPETPGDLYVANLAAIESVIGFICRQRRLRGDDAKEFAAVVHLRLVEDDYEVLRKFQGRSALKTYLTVVIQRLAFDFQAERWGPRWRPSLLARSSGAEAIRLEELVVRDGLRLDDAIATLEREMAVTDRTHLEALAARFPARSRRQYVGDELLQHMAADAPDAERLLVQTEEEARFERVKARLSELVSSLDSSDQLVLQFRFQQNMKVADIARLLQTDQKRLYRRIDEALRRLRTLLEQEGLDVSAVRTMLTAVESGPSGPEESGPIRLYERNTP